MRVPPKHQYRAYFGKYGFFLTDFTVETGRRIFKAEFSRAPEVSWVPEFFVEDLGRKIKEISINGFVVSQTYQQDRNNLLEEFQSGKVGTLSIPYFPNQQVYVISCRLMESTQEGGIAHFAVTFAEAGDKVIADDRLIPRTGLSSFDKAADWLDGVLKQAIQEEKYLQEATEAVLKVTDTLFNIVSPLMQATDDINLLKGAVLDFRKSVLFLAGEPQRFLSAIQSVWDAVFNTHIAPATQLQIAINSTTALGEQLSVARSKKDEAVRKELHNALTLSMMLTLLESAVRAAPTLKYTNQDERSEFGKMILKEIELCQFKVKDPNIATYLEKLKTAMIHHLAPTNRSESAQSLKSLYSVRTETALPLLLILHELDGNLSRYEKIIEQNRIKFPLRIEQNQSIELEFQ